MKILIQSAKIISKGSPHHLKKRNVLINSGRIAEIGDKNYQADKVIDAEGMILSIGWMDLGAYCGDPGLEHKEDLISIGKAAAAGGFTELVLLPNTQPTVQTKNEVSYITQNNTSRLVQLHPIAAVTKSCKGEELTEMIDLHEAGAVAFSDGLKSIWHTDLFLKALQYLQKFNGVLIDHPEDKWLSMFGQMHEGITSTALGLKGIPRIAEEVAVRKNLELLEYAGGRLHIAHISTARSVEMIRAAKKKGLQVTCDITGYQALLDDTALTDFDTNFKLSPPLREKLDNDALVKGLKEGVIDVLTTGHLPQDDESKLLEFDQAEVGMINLQTFSSQLTSLSKSVELEVLIEKVTTAPRAILNMELPKIEEEAKANLTLFDPNAAWTFTSKSNLSKSKNSPWIEKELKGRAVAVFNNNKHWLDV
jgi:dihydroorotase